ncbi:hypothetical protein FISHEDRAFT_67587 [Fistulina hepatica ATCC 64428]|nr:hypothetical protein FISHEDRAFT_67587 [Fistulina hepatica ATCC 64428]
MRFLHFLGLLVSLASVSVSASAEEADGADAAPRVPELSVVASFPEDNPFGHVVNGEKNTIKLAVENKSGENLTLIAIGGAVYQAESDNLIRNLTVRKYGVGLPEVSMNLPYAFHSESLRLVQPGEVRLDIWVDYMSESIMYRLHAFDSTVTVVEPEVSFLDFKMLTTYAMVTVILTGVSYLAYTSFFPASKKPRTKRVTAPSTPAVLGSAGVSGYEEEWIPEHHLKKTRAGKKKGRPSTASGDELNDGEASGAEGKKKLKK